jgi:hypothetical protein
MPVATLWDNRCAVVCNRDAVVIGEGAVAVGNKSLFYLLDFHYSWLRPKVCGKQGRCIQEHEELGMWNIWFGSLVERTVQDTSAWLSLK